MAALWTAVTVFLPIEDAYWKAKLAIFRDASAVINLTLSANPA
jgi:hypothetical protein